MTGDLFTASDLKREGVARWRKAPAISGPGVYVVSLTSALHSFEGALVKAPLSESTFARWLEVRPELTLDGQRPTVAKLMDRLGRFWIPDEVVLYVGLATDLVTRTDDYYRTPIGARGPHSGGYFLKLLADLDRLWVHYAPCDDPDDAEDRMLRRFCENVSGESKRALLDPTHPFPFGNLEWPRGVRKAHGLRGTREPRVSSRSRGRR